MATCIWIVNNLHEYKYLIKFYFLFHDIREMK